MGLLRDPCTFFPPETIIQPTFAVEIVPPRPEPSVTPVPPSVMTDAPRGSVPRRIVQPRVHSNKASPQNQLAKSDSPVAIPPVEVRVAQPAEYAKNAPPEYPLLARRRGLQGTVTLVVTIDASGEVIDLAVGQSSGHEVLDRSALRAVAGWRFMPATAAGAPVLSKASVPIEFKLSR